MFRTQSRAPSAHWERLSPSRQRIEARCEASGTRAQSRIARPLGLRLCGFVLRRFRVHAASLGNDLRRDRNRLPSLQSLENALGILDRSDVAVVLLDHLY